MAITEHGKPVNTRLCHTVGENYQPHSEILGIESCQNGPCVPVPNVGSTTKLVFHSVLKSLDYSFHTFDYFMSEQTTTKIYIVIFSTFFIFIRPKSQSICLQVLDAVAWAE